MMFYSILFASEGGFVIIVIAAAAVSADARAAVSNDGTIHLRIASWRPALLKVLRPFAFESN